MRWRLTVLCALAAAAIPAMALAAQSPRRQIVVFNADGWQDAASGAWRIPVHGWVCDFPAEKSGRAGVIGFLRRSLRVPGSSAAATMLRARAGWLLADAVSNVPMFAQVGPKRFSLGKSTRDGHFGGVIELDAEALRTMWAAGQLDADGWLTYRIYADDGEARDAQGRCQLLGREGVSVVSDIDDTVKITCVGDHDEMMLNTFCRPFQGVEGMAALYQHWARQGASFHYVSGSPWQFHEPLRTFLTTKGFPAGSLHLKLVGVLGGPFISAMQDGAEFKPPIIESLLQRYPQRQFILVGDSTEEDPEAYGEIARKHPEQVQLILIRQVGAKPLSTKRLEKAFSGVPKSKWRVFRDAGELADGAAIPSETF